MRRTPAVDIPAPCIAIGAGVRDVPRCAGAGAEVFVVAKKVFRGEGFDGIREIRLHCLPKGLKFVKRTLRVRSREVYIVATGRK